MFEWSEEHAMVRDAVRQFVDNEIRPRREELEFGDVAPYDVLRKMFQTFGLDALAREQFKKRIERERTAADAANRRPSRDLLGTCEPAARCCATTASAGRCSSTGCSRPRRGARRSTRSIRGTRPGWRWASGPSTTR